MARDTAPQYGVPQDFGKDFHDIIYGLTSANQVIPIKINDDGSLAITATLDGSDIEIGAVELKDGSSDNRAVINASGELSVIAASWPLPTGAATEATLSSFRSDFNAEDFATESTLSGFRTDFNAVNFATETTLASIDVSIDVALSTRASETTLSGFRADFNAEDFATESTLLGIKAATDQLTFSATRLLTDGSGVIQPVSGTVTALQGTSPWVISGTVTATPAGTQDVNIVSTITLPTLVNNTGGASAVNIQDGGNSITVDGSVLVSNFPAIQTIAISQSGTDNDVDVVSSALPTGAATEATLLGVLTTSAFQARINTLGQKTMANSTPVVLSSDQSAVPVTDNGGSLTVDAVDFDIRDLSHTQDSVKVGDGTDFITIETSGNIFSATESRLFTMSNKMYSVALEVNASSNGIDNMAILIRNPVGSGKILYFYMLSANVQINNVFVTYKLFANPTITTNGTSQTPVSMNVGGGAGAAVALINTLPTVSANGSALAAKTVAQNSSEVNLVTNGIIALNPNNSMLVTANPQSNNRVSAFTLHWAEI